ncbi:MAG: EamA family transporter [Chromatiales bacterium]|jgi:drug/metabolite transporter (DMT)-like permease
MPNPEDRLALRDGLIAVTAFAATLPLTRIALEGFAPLPLTFARLLGASISAMLLLKIAGASWPKRHQLVGLLLVALGGVIGFPLLTAFALDGREAAPAAIPLALMPLATAVWSRLRGHEAPGTSFWLWAIAGSAAVLHFVFSTGTTLAAPELFTAGLAAAIAYAEGGHLAREMPGWQVMAWALAFTVPVAAFGFGHTWAQQPLPLTAAPWMALAFLALITQFGAFWFWYRALATSVSRTSQLQLLQPFLTLLLAAFLLGESIPAELWLYAAAVVITVHLARTRGQWIQQPKETTQ